MTRLPFQVASQTTAILQYFSLHTKTGNRRSGVSPGCFINTFCWSLRWDKEGPGSNLKNGCQSSKENPGDKWGTVLQPHVTRVPDGRGDIICKKSQTDDLESKWLRRGGFRNALSSFLHLCFPFCIRTRRRMTWIDVLNTCKWPFNKPKIKSAHNQKHYIAV